MDSYGIALVGTYPPQHCGIATFTADLRNALHAAHPHRQTTVCAVRASRFPLDYPAEVSAVIERDEARTYERAAARLNASGVSILSLQHEFGIFGGLAGEHVLRLLDGFDGGVVPTLHTVSPHLDQNQRRVMRALIERSDKVVTMARKGREILIDCFEADPAKIVIVPHGVPSRRAPSCEAMKARLGFAGRQVLMTFGLIGRSKGLETMIHAMPAIARRHPNALYVVLGATHPAVLAHEGEGYREMLIGLAQELGVADNVAFVNRYVGADELVDYLSAADIYVTPYMNEAQVTSGTLSYAYALGLPVISTPYWHAAELLGGDGGLLVGFGDRAAFAEAADRLLSDPELRRRMSLRAMKVGETMRWPAVSERYLHHFAAVRRCAEAPAGTRRSSHADA